MVAKIIHQTILAALFGLVFSYANFTLGAEVKVDAPDRYVVKKGDTLWAISALYLSEPWRWPELWVKNTQIKNPHLIYPGDIIVLSVVNGESVLTVERSKTKIVLSPDIKRVDKRNAINVLPWSLLEPYVAHSWIVNDESFNALPQILGNGDGNITFANNDFLLTRQASSTQEQYFVVRQKGTIQDMEGNVIGFQLNHVANAEIVVNGMETEWLVRVTHNQQEVRRGDRLWNTPAFPENKLELKAADSVIGNVVGGLNENRLYGKYDVVVVDLGQSQISPGTVLGIYDQGPLIIDAGIPRYIEKTDTTSNLISGESIISQPALKSGEMIIFSVFEKASYGLIIRSDKAVKRGFIVSEP